MNTQKSMDIFGQHFRTLYFGNFNNFMQHVCTILKCIIVSPFEGGGLVGKIPTKVFEKTVYSFHNLTISESLTSKQKIDSTVKFRILLQWVQWIRENTQF